MYRTLRSGGLLSIAESSLAMDGTCMLRHMLSVLFSHMLMQHVRRFLEKGRMATSGAMTQPTANRGCQRCRKGEQFRALGVC